MVWNEERSPWWLVPIFAIWVNVHGSWLYGVVVLVACSFTYVTAQIFGTGLIASRFLGMQFEITIGVR